LAAIASCDATAIQALPTIPTTPPEHDLRDQCVVLPQRSTNGKAPNRLLLGPTTLTGKGVSKAKREFAQGEGYTVSMTLNGDGLKAFNDLAGKSYGQPSPTNEVAIVLDGVVQSNPAFQAASFDGPVQISGNFSATEASDLAKLINYGALPVQLTKETT